MSLRKSSEKKEEPEKSTEVNITYFSKLQAEAEELHANCDEGRGRRPLMIVENGAPRLQPKHLEKIALGEWTWDDLVKNGLIEYLDASEEENAYIAISMDKVGSEHSHSEIATFTILGICASTIPCPELNPSPGNSSQSAMSK